MRYTHLTADARYASAILELWWRQNTTANLHHVVADCETELLHVGVVVEVGTTNEIVDFAFTKMMKTLVRLAIKFEYQLK